MKKNSLCVLVADDYEPWRRFVCTSLKEHLSPSVLVEAADGAEAVKRAQDDQPDLIVLDIGLPKLNGIEAARAIMECSSQSRILFLSEERSLEVVKEGLRLGARGYLVKSSAAADLWPAVQAVLRGEVYLSPSLGECGGLAPSELPVSTSDTPREHLIAPLRQFVGNLPELLKYRTHLLLPMRNSVGQITLVLTVAAIAFLTGTLLSSWFRSAAPLSVTRTLSSSPDTPVTKKIGASGNSDAIAKRLRVLEADKIRLNAKLSAAMRQIRVLRKSLEQGHSELARTKARMRKNEIRRVPAEAKLQQSRSREASLQTELVATRYRVRELEEKLVAEAELAENDRQLIALSARSDIRDVIASRDLHIIDVADVEAGEKHKPFGRVFYSEGKSLIFFAYDLSNTKAKYTYHAWGYRDGTPRSARSLGILENDDKRQRRWVFKFNDAAVLADIDSVCITLEPSGQMRDRPTGRKVLNAYLGSPPNHP